MNRYTYRIDKSGNVCEESQIGESIFLHNIDLISKRFILYVSANEIKGGH